MTALNHQSTVGDTTVSSPRSARRVWVLLAVLSGVIFLIGMVLSRNMTGPIVYEDGLAYFANARFLAGTRVVPDLGASHFYYPGYSMLIAPLYLLPIGPGSVYQGVLILNAALGSVQFLLGYFFLRRLLATGPILAIAASLVAALYPGVLLLESYEYSDNLFRVVFLGCVIAAGLYFREVSTWRGVLLGLLASAAYLVHPRGLGVVAVTAAVLLVTAIAKRRISLALGGLAALVVGATASRMLNQMLIDAMYRSDDRSVAGLLARLLDADFWLAVPLRASGQVWYLSVATAGLFPIGVALAVAAAWRGWRAIKQRIGTSPDDVMLSYLLLSSTALFAIAVIFMTPIDQRLGRLDHLIYGRYNDGFAIVFVMLAVSRLAQAADGVRATDSGLMKRVPMVGIAVIGVATTLLVVLGGSALASGRPFAPISAVGISAYVTGEGTIPVLAATLGGAVLSVLVLVMVMAPRISKWSYVVFLCVVFVAFSFVAEQRVLRGYNDYWMNLLTLDDTVRYVGTPEVMGYDESDLSFYGLNGYQFWLDLTSLELFDSESGESPPDVNLVIASETWDEAERREARLIAIEPRLDQGLWVLPGEVQDDMAKAGFLLASDPTGPLPAEAMASDIEILSGLESGDSIRTGQSRSVLVRVRHAGLGSPWIPLGAWDPSPVDGSVRLVARWLPVEETDVAAIQIAELPRSVLPGEEVVVDLTVSPSNSEGALEPGEYVLRIGLVQEGVGWFDENGDAQLDLRIQVTGDS